LESEYENRLLPSIVKEIFDDLGVPDSTRYDYTERGTAEENTTLYVVYFDVFTPTTIKPLSASTSENGVESEIILKGDKWDFLNERYQTEYRTYVYDISWRVGRDFDERDWDEHDEIKINNPYFTPQTQRIVYEIYFTARQLTDRGYTVVKDF